MRTQKEAMSRKRESPGEPSGPDLAKATADLDEEGVIDTFGPPPAEAKAQWARAKRKRGRPRKGQGVKVISVSVEQELLARSDRLAEKLGITRAELISRGLQAALAAADKSAR